MDYDDPTQDLHIHFTAGEQWLNGEDAVKFLRFRQNNDGTGYGWGDLERIEAQQDFLMTVARQLLSLGNIPNLTTVANIFEEDVITDLSAANIVWYATEALKLSADDIHFMTVPNDPSCNILLPSGENKAVISIHVDEWLEMVNTYLNPFTMEITESNVDILTFEGPNTYAGLGLFYATSGVIQSTYLNQFNQYNAGLAADRTGERRRHMRTPKEWRLWPYRPWRTRRGLEIKVLEMEKGHRLADYFVICTAAPPPMSRLWRTRWRSFWKRAGRSSSTGRATAPAAGCCWITARWLYICSWRRPGVLQSGAPVGGRQGCGALKNSKRKARLPVTFFRPCGILSLGLYRVGI